MAYREATANRQNESVKCYSLYRNSLAGVSFVMYNKDRENKNDEARSGNIYHISGAAIDAYNNFYNSSGHKANMLDETYNSHVVGNYNSYWIIFFER